MQSIEQFCDARRLTHDTLLLDSIVSQYKHILLSTAGAAKLRPIIEKRLSTAIHARAFVTSPLNPARRIGLCAD
jgi:hypothetical protein